MASQPNAVDAALLADRLRALETYLYPDTAAVRTMLGGMSAEERAMSVVENSVLSDLERLRALRQKGASLPTDDPALELVGVFSDQYRTFREAWHDLTQTEARLTRRLARARDAVRNAPVLSASPGAPRLTDGRVLGYPYNGTMAPPFTTLFGLYGQARSFSGERDWTLPDRWTSASTSLNRSLPLNLATSTDPAVGTSGGPLLNRHLEIVGLAFDTNIQAVGGAYLFLPDRMRTVSLDLRTLRQALLTVYDARPLVGELFGGSGSDTTRP